MRMPLRVFGEQNCQGGSTTREPSFYGAAGGVEFVSDFCHGHVAKVVQDNGSSLLDGEFLEGLDEGNVGDSGFVGRRFGVGAVRWTESLTSSAPAADSEPGGRHADPGFGRAVDVKGAPVTPGTHERFLDTVLSLGEVAANGVDLADEAPVRVGVKSLESALVHAGSIETLLHHDRAALSVENEVNHGVAWRPERPSSPASSQHSGMSTYRSAARLHARQKRMRHPRCNLDRPAGRSYRIIRLKGEPP